MCREREKEMGERIKSKLIYWNQTITNGSMRDTLHIYWPRRQHIFFMNNSNKIPKHKTAHEYKHTHINSYWLTNLKCCTSKCYSTFSKYFIRLLFQFYEKINHLASTLKKKITFCHFQLVNFTISIFNHHLNILIGFHSIFRCFSYSHFLMRKKKTTTTNSWFSCIVW